MLAGVWSVYFSFGLTISALAPLIAPILRDLQMSHTEMGSVLGAWQLIYIASAVPCGVLVDRLGPRRALLLAALLMAASGFLRSVAVDHVTLFLSVALFGLGGPIISSGAPKVVAVWFRGRERGFAMGVYMTGPALASVLTLSSTNSVFMPLMDGDWRDVIRLWAFIVLGCGLLWLAVSSHREGREMEGHMAAGKRVPQLQELKALLSLAPVRIVLVMSIAIFLFNHALNNWLPELLRSNGMTAVQAGYWAAVPTVVGIAGSLLIPRLATPERRLLILGLLALAAGAASIFLLSDPGLPLLTGLILQGIARSSLMTVAVLTLIEMPGIGERKAGTASGLFFSAAEIGGVSGPLLFGLLYDVTGDFSAALHMLTGVAAFLLAATVLLGRQSR